jgi:hypothetical protein
MCSIASKRSILRSEDGAALAVTLLMLLGLASMALMISVISSSDLNVSGNDRMYQASLDVAEAGLAEAMHRMSLRPGTNVTVGGTTFDASIRDASNPPDPNWRARIFLTAPGGAPAAGGSDFHTGTVQPPGDYLEYSDPSDVAGALLIQHRMADLDGDGDTEIVLYDPSKIPSENATTGVPVERITVRGREGTARRSIMADVIRFPISVNVVASLSANAGVDLRGNVTVCGHDHRSTTPIGTQLPGCSPAWDQPGGHLHAVQTTGDPVMTQGSTDLLGSPTPTNTNPANEFMDILQTLGVSADDFQSILDAADHTSVDADPLDGITYINGDLSINDGTGTGLLYVTGDLELKGNFSWRGLIYVEGNLSNTGNTWILGGVVVRGTGLVAVDFGAGTPAILFSRDMLTEALSSSMRYIVLSWKEI